MHPICGQLSMILKGVKRRKDQLWILLYDLLTLSFTTRNKSPLICVLLYRKGTYSPSYPTIHGPYWSFPSPSRDSLVSTLPSYSIKSRVSLSSSRFTARSMGFRSIIHTSSQYRSLLFASFTAAVRSCATGSPSIPRHSESDGSQRCW